MAACGSPDLRGPPHRYAGRFSLSIPVAPGNLSPRVDLPALEEAIA